MHHSNEDRTWIETMLIVSQFLNFKLILVFLFTMEITIEFLWNVLYINFNSQTVFIKVSERVRKTV